MPGVIKNRAPARVRDPTTGRFRKVPVQSSSRNGSNAAAEQRRPAAQSNEIAFQRLAAIGRSRQLPASPSSRSAPAVAPESAHPVQRLATSVHSNGNATQIAPVQRRIAVQSNELSIDWQNPAEDETAWRAHCRRIKNHYKSRYLALETALKEDTRNEIRILENRVKQLERANAGYEEEQAQLEDEQRELEDEKEEFEQEKQEFEDEKQEFEDEKQEYEDEKEQLEERVEELDNLEEEKEELVQMLNSIEDVIGPEFLPENATNLTTFIGEHWAAKRRRPYRRVKVLMAAWQADDLGLLPEMNELKKVFGQLYKFEVHPFLIPSSHPTAALSRFAIEFLEDSPLDTLFIFYYGGHGAIQPPRNDSIWSATETGSPSMPSAGIQTLFEESRADALLIYDSCCSADTSISRPTFQGLTDLIASCGFQTTAPGPGRQSFTYALTKVLKDHHMTQSPLSVSDMYLKILARLRHTQERTVETTPVHCTLTNEKCGRRIVFEPITHQPLLDLSTKNLPLIFTLSFATDSPDCNAWAEWIANAPPDAYHFLNARFGRHWTYDDWAAEYFNRGRIEDAPGS